MMIYPVPQNAPNVNTGMNVLRFPEATDISRWYGVYLAATAGARIA